MNLYLDVVAAREGNMSHGNKLYNLFFKSKSNQRAEYTKSLIKSKLNQAQMKLSISAFKTLKNSQLLIKSERKKSGNNL